MRVGVRGMRSEDSSPRSPRRALERSEDRGAEAVLWDLLKNEQFAGGATRTSSPARGLRRNLCASPNDYETYEKQSAPHSRPSSLAKKSVRLADSPDVLADSPAPQFSPRRVSGAAMGPPPPPVPPPQLSPQSLSPRQPSPTRHLQPDEQSLLFEEQEVLRQRFAAVLTDMESSSGVPVSERDEVYGASVPSSYAYYHRDVAEAYYHEPQQPPPTAAYPYYASSSPYSTASPYAAAGSPLAAPYPYYHQPSPPPPPPASFAGGLGGWNEPAWAEPLHAHARTSPRPNER